MPEITPEQASVVLSRAECLYTQNQVEASLDTMALAINQELQDKNPIFVCIMTGGTVPFAGLVMRFKSPCEIDYVHATRYEKGLSGGVLKWISGPTISPEGRVVVLVDDIFDEGTTLAAIEEKYRSLGAVKIYNAVLVVKDRPRETNLEIHFRGLDVPDRYVFGYGMDYKGYLRNAPGIFAEVPEDS